MGLVQLSCRRYQPRGVLRALPWRVARRRSGSRMVVGVRGGVLRVRGGLAGWAAGVLRVRVDVWVACGGFGRAWRCWVASWVGSGLWGAVRGCGGGVLRWGPVAFWGALVVSLRPADRDGRGVCGARRRRCMYPLAVGSVSCCVCVNRRRLRCTFGPLLCGLLLAGGALLPPSGCPCVWRGVGVGPV